jgi:hypothetical protein
MKPNIDQLSQLQRVEAPAAIYDKVLLQINQRKPAPAWLKIAAALLFCTVSAELYLLTQSWPVQQNQTIENVVEIPNNMLYHE